MTQCTGLNCPSTDGTHHSPECIAEHAAAVAGGRFVKGEPTLSDEWIELYAQRHIAPYAERMKKAFGLDVPYQQTEQFKRVRAYTRSVENALGMRKPRNGEDGYVCPAGKAQAEARKSLANYVTDLNERLISAIEGECDGLAITDEQASNILAYLQYGADLDCPATLCMWQVECEAKDKRIKELEAAASGQKLTDEQTLIGLLRNVCHYADSVCGMLRQGGWPGKAEALESRIKAVIDYDASVSLPPHLPCPICNGVEGCDHTVPERIRASDSATASDSAEGGA